LFVGFSAFLSSFSISFSFFVPPSLSLPTDKSPLLSLIDD
jgi:hypothetical protein